MDRGRILIKLHDVNELLSQKPKDGPKFSSKLPHMARKMIGVLTKEGRVNQRTLATYMRISPQAVSENIKKLEKLGVITKESGLQKNENYIFLTEQGMELSKVFQAELEKHVASVFQDFDDLELEQLEQLLNKIMR